MQPDDVSFSESPSVGGPSAFGCLTPRTMRMRFKPHSKRSQEVFYGLEAAPKETRIFKS